MLQSKLRDAFAVSPSRSHHILTSIPTVIYVLAVTAEGFPSEWVSDSVKRILGYEVEEALAPNWWVDCLHPDDRDSAIEKTSVLMTEGHLVQEYRFRSKGEDRDKAGTATFTGTSWVCARHCSGATKRNALAIDFRRKPAILFMRSLVKLSSSGLP